MENRASHEPAARSDGPPGRPGELAIVLSGGGARGAYQVGVLRYIARRYPELRVPILTGVSAGSVNAVYLANHTGSFADKVEALTALWRGLSLERIFRVDNRSLLGHVASALTQITITGGRSHVPEPHGLVDTAPLERLLLEELGSQGGELSGIGENLARKALAAVSVTTTHYGTGQTVTFCQGREVQDWNRPLRRSATTELTVAHVMASAALPLFFPAVAIDGGWYGDGGVRLHSPLAPATHLGASRILAISTSPTVVEQTAAPTGPEPYPPPAQVLGVLYNSVFLDLLDQDAVHLKRINRLLEGRRDGPDLGLRPVELLMLRPSRSLGSLAQEFEPELPALFRFLMRRLGTRQARSRDVVSWLMFHGEYASRVIELGEADAEARGAELDHLLA